MLLQSLQNTACGKFCKIGTCEFRRQDSALGLVLGFFFGHNKITLALFPEKRIKSPSHILFNHLQLQISGAPLVLESRRLHD